MRGLLLGTGLGIVIGVTIAPMIGRSGNSTAPPAIERVVNGFLDREERDRNDWPSGEQALTAVFENQGWDIGAKASSTIEIMGCIEAAANIACQFELNLAWLDQPRIAEAIFEENAGKWHIIDLRAR